MLRADALEDLKQATSDGIQFAAMQHQLWACHAAWRPQLPGKMCYSTLFSTAVPTTHWHKPFALEGTAPKSNMLL